MLRYHVVSIARTLAPLALAMAVGSAASAEETAGRPPATEGRTVGSVRAGLADEGRSASRDSTPGSSSEPDSTPPPAPPREPSALDKLLGRQAILVTGDGEIVGKLVEVNDTLAVIEEDDGERVPVEHAAILEARRRFPAPSAPQADSYLAPEQDAAEADAAAPSGAPRANHGFQMAVATGYAIPFGQSDGSMAQSDLVSGQVPVLLHIGGKVGPNVFFGLYAGAGFGGAGDALSSVCNQTGVSCAGATYRMGFEAQYHMAPEARFNPYIGYGAGFEYTEFSASAGGHEESVGVLGPEFAHFTLGADYRPLDAVGFGPYVDLAIGQYGAVYGSSGSGELPDKAVHGWLTLGVRATLFP